jgi:hypothetical protein
MPDGLREGIVLKFALLSVAHLAVSRNVPTGKRRGPHEFPSARSPARLYASLAVHAFGRVAHLCGVQCRI